MATSPRSVLLARMVRAEPPEHAAHLDDCWLWTGPTTWGYGTVTIAGTTHRAHRLAFEAFVGPIPEGAHICHRCDVRNCINPGHLFAGTRQQNMDDMVAKGRSTAGPKHAGAKLTDSDVLDIRRRATSGETQVSLAAAYGVTKSQISSIVRGDRWTHLLPPDFVRPEPGRWARGAA